MSQPVGIIDIGSNSVRMVAYDGAARNPITLFNEKISAGLGRNIASTGELDTEGVARAITALERYHVICEGLGVDDLRIIATAAVRDASNGRHFVEAVEALCGVPVKTLSGREEAKLAAYGVLSFIPGATGLVGDLGGGSLELVDLKSGEIGDGITSPIGALRLMDVSNGNIDRARTHVKKELKKVAWLTSLNTPVFYAVGGAWRTMARIHMRETDYPVRVLQHYVIKRNEVLDLARAIASHDEASLSQISEVASYRRDSLPFSAIVLEHLFEMVPFEEMIVSANGVREGLLYDGLADALRQEDPLIRSCHGLARRLSHVSALGVELIPWTEVFFKTLLETETKSQKRLREAACLLSDIAWRSHPDHRGSNAFREVLYGPLTGLSHPERLLLAFAVYYRYETGKPPSAQKYANLISPEEENHARLIGLALKLGAKITSGVSGVLPQCPLRVVGPTMCLTLPQQLEKLVGEVLLSRLAALAKRVNLQSALNIEGDPAAP